MESCNMDIICRDTRADTVCAVAQPADISDFHEAQQFTCFQCTVYVQYVRIGVILSPSYSA